MSGNISVICSGNDYCKRKMKKHCKLSDYIIAVDGGLNILDELGIVPSFILGDMDSVKPELLSKYKDVEMQVYEKEKDLTDSELGIQKALSYNPENIFVFGATGNYIDHSFANLLNLLRNFTENSIITIVTKNAQIFPVMGEKIISDAKERRFSFFPVGDVKELFLSGFKYNFKNNQKLTPLDYSVSNVITENQAIIKIKEGMLICALFDKGYN